MAVTVHRNLARIADIAEAKGNRPFLQGIHVVESNGSVLVEATDGSVLVRVTNPNMIAEFPIVDGAPANGAAVDAIIPAKTFKETLMRNKVRGGIAPVLEQVSISQTEETLTLAHTDLASPTVVRVQAIKGPYPRTDQVFPEGEPVATFSVDAALLARALTVLATVQDDDRHHGVTISVYGEDRPIKIEARTMPEGGTASAIVCQVRTG